MLDLLYITDSFRRQMGRGSDLFFALTLCYVVGVFESWAVIPFTRSFLNKVCFLWRGGVGPRRSSVINTGKRSVGNLTIPRGDRCRKWVCLG